MNPKLSASYAEVGRWLRNFGLSHGLREHPRAEVMVEMEGARHPRSYGLRLRLGAQTAPPPGAPPIELGYEEVREGRTRFSWCEDLARQIREEVRRLAAEPPEQRSGTA